MERVTGIEPAFSAWEADVLPLNYTRRRVHRSGTSPLDRQRIHAAAPRRRRTQAGVQLQPATHGAAAVSIPLVNAAGGSQYRDSSASMTA